jgi:two-component system, chemotaxis family, chemotaxis protein CheY
MLTILSVDDSALMRSIIKKFISRSGVEFQFIEAFDGKDGVEKYKAKRPDVVFMDIVMPNMNGIEAVKAIRTFDPSAKIIMCTSLKEKVHEDEAAALGVVGYVIKPFSSQQISDVMKKIKT